MNLIDALLGEHAVFYSNFERLEEVARTAEHVEEVRAAVHAVGGALASHANLENELLLGSLASRLGEAGPIGIMRAEHDEVEQRVSALEKVQDLDSARSQISELLALTRAHFVKEEHLVFAMARQLLGHEDLQRLGDLWAHQRHIEV